MRKLLIAAAAAGLAAALAAPAHANLLTNGSFEDTTNFVDNGQDTMVLPVSSTAMAGWTVISRELAWIGPANPFGLSANDGNYFLDLTSYGNSGTYGGVSQTIATVTGASYLLSYDLGGDLPSGTPDSITACGGATCQTASIVATGRNEWANQSFSFVATGTSTLISLTGIVGGIYIGLDNVSVTGATAAIPEPSTYALLAMGLAATVGMARRRGNRAG